MANDFSTIKNHTELRFRIMQLNSQREEQELELKKGITELYHAMHPINLLKKMVSDFATDKQVQFDATKIGLNFGSDFLIGKLLGSNMNIKKYLSSLILQKASDYVLNNHPEKIAWGIEKLSNLFSSFSKKETNKTGMTAE
ncbi:MAG: hypothetical protein JWM14_3325 [Chitinophagaceae bacterium]|nr:hypothetical protein [Chitinophagaceae bacterium]